MIIKKISLLTLFIIVSLTYLNASNSLKKVQVKYDIKYLDKNNGKNLFFKITKIDFSGETVTEKARKFKNYVLVSNKNQTITLDNKDRKTIIFYYLNKKLVEDKLSKTNSQNKFKKSQVKYDIEYIDKQTGKKIFFKITKIDFLGEKVTEKSRSFNGYRLISNNLQTITLDSLNRKTIKFYYLKEKVFEEKLEKEKNLAIAEINNLIWLSVLDKNNFKEFINSAKNQEEIAGILKKAKNKNNNQISYVDYQIEHMDIETKEILFFDIKTDFEGKIVEEKALKFDGYGLLSSEKERIVLNKEKENKIIFKYKHYDNPEIPLKDFLKKKIDYSKPLVYKNINFTGKPDELRDYLIRKIHNGDFYVKYIATKEDQEKAYYDLFNKPSLGGNVRFARNWTHHDDVKDKTIPRNFTVAFTYNDSHKDMQKAEDKIDQFIKKNISEDMPDLKKVKIIHDYIVTNTTFALNPDNTSMHVLPSGRPSNSLVAAIIENQAVCEGYAMLFNRMMERIGIESFLVAGRYTPSYYIKYVYGGADKYNKIWEKSIAKKTFGTKVNHAWNLIKLDNKWYHIDTYHDDYFGTNQPYSAGKYYRFLKSDKFMIYEAGRFWDKRYIPASENEYNHKFEEWQEKFVK